MEKNCKKKGQINMEKKGKCKQNKTNKSWVFIVPDDRIQKRQ